MKRGDRIGCSSPKNTPIFVCTGAESIYDVVQNTEHERLEDLVFMQNGFIREHLQERSNNSADVSVRLGAVTIAVLYFSVLERGGVAKEGGTTYVNGKWSSEFARILRAGGVRCEEVASPADIDALALAKLLWASCLWLVAHHVGGRPVGACHSLPDSAGLLRGLVRELLPVAQHALGTEASSSSPVAREALGSEEALLAHMASYSARIPAALPSLPLALQELPFRNGWFLAHGPPHAQPLHLQLLREHGADVGLGGAGGGQGGQGGAEEK